MLIIAALEHALKSWLEGRDHNDKDARFILECWGAIQRFGGSLTDPQDTYGLVELAQKFLAVSEVGAYSKPLPVPLDFPPVLLTLAKAAYDVRQLLENHDVDYEYFEHQVRKGNYGTFDSSNMSETFLKWLYAVKCVGKDVDDAVDTYLHHRNEVCKQNLEEMVRKTEECRRALAASEQAVQTRLDAKRKAHSDARDDDGSEKKAKASL